MNKDIVEGKWTQLKGEIQKTWGKLTGDELDKAKGDMKSISGIVQERYGIGKEEADRRLKDISSRFSEDARQTSESLKEKAAGVVEKAKNKLKSDEKH